MELTGIAADREPLWMLSWWVAEGELMYDAVLQFSP